MENPFKQKPFEVDPAISAENEASEAAEAAHEAEHGVAPLQQFNPLEYYANSPEVLEEVEAGIAELNKHPEAKELASRLANPHIERDEFMRMAGDWNDDVSSGGQPAEGSYQTIHFPFDRIDRKMDVKVFENGRVTFNVGGAE